VHFSYSAVKKANNQYEVHIKSILEPKWHIYSVTNPEGGAEATELKLEGVKTIGKVKEVGKMKTIYDKEFKMDQKFFENTVDFVQIVDISNGAKKLTGSISYMVCNDRQCLPPKEVPFEIKL
jgi:thiol:disulfide interchange protein DsbD